MARALVAQIIYLHLGASEQKLARIRESMLMLTKGWEHDQIKEIVREALEETVEPIIYAEALDLIEAHRAAGYKVYLVSASPEVIVAPLAEHLGVDGAIASRPVVDDEGRYTGEMEFYAYGPFKAEAIQELARQEGLDLAESSAYSDSYTDLPMLEAVGHPVAVNPDRVLAKVARERDWEVMQFTKPVRLRDRVSVPSWSMTAAAAGITAAASACGAGCVALAAGARRSAAGRPSLSGARPRAARGCSGRTEPLGGDDTQGNDDGEDQKLLHGAEMVTGPITSRSRTPSADPARGDARLRRSGGPVPRCPTKDGATSTWPAPRSDGSARGSG